MSYFTYNEHRIHYVSEGSGNPILFLPGNTASSTAHIGDVGKYAESFCAASLDFLGTGSSDRISPWPIDWWAEGARQTAALIDHLSCGKAVLVGASGGAVAALKTAIMYPEKVRGVLADSFSLVFSREMYENNVLKEREERSEEKAAFWQAMHGPDWEAVIEEDTRMIASFVEEKEGRWFPEGLSAVSCPVLCTASSKDSFISDPANEMLRVVRQIPEASLYLHHAGDHPFMWTAPDTFSALLETFLGEVCA